jgi:hypothetical protein
MTKNCSHQESNLDSPKQFALKGVYWSLVLDWKHFLLKLVMSTTHLNKLKKKEAKLKISIK